MEYIIVFIFGTIIGSFLNVCIYRIPLEKSIVSPRSFCPFCEKPLRWFDNVPLVSFLLLRGKCRDCGKPISIRYFVVELITALSGVGLLFYFSLGLPFFVWWFFACILIVIAFIDLEHQEIPDEITLPGIFAGLMLSAFSQAGEVAFSGIALRDAFFGVVAGGASMYIMGFLGEKAFHKEALGGGDIKLMAMIGAFIGWKLVLLTFFIAPILGSGVGVIALLKGKKEVIPYAPYLALGAFISLLYGNRILGCLFF